MKVNREILMTIIKNSNNHLEGEQEILTINEQQLNALSKELTELFSLHVVKNWVAVKDDMPPNCDQVFVKYENGKYGINEWWGSDNCWKYQFDNMIVKEWCEPPCS